MEQQELTPLDKAVKILKSKEEEEICVKANICPKCGEELRKVELRTEIVKECPSKEHFYMVKISDRYNESEDELFEQGIYLRR